MNESRRLYRTMDTQLAKNPSGYLVGDRVTIADIAVWPWVTAYSKILSNVVGVCAPNHDPTEYSGLASLDEFPHVKEWMYKLLKRPGFEKGRHVPTPHVYLDLNELSEETLREMGRQRQGWIQEAMKRDAQA